MPTTEKTFGQQLKAMRELIPLTLREVESICGISNAYLSQLENDKIKQPSAHALYKLATAYKVDIQELLSAAGMIPEFKTNHFPGLAVTPDEEKQLLEYLQFIRWRNKRNGHDTVASYLGIHDEAKPGHMDAKALGF